MSGFEQRFPRNFTGAQAALFAPLSLWERARVRVPSWPSPACPAYGARDSLAPGENERMDDQRKRELAGGMNELAQRFWAGEAEICRRFWGAPRTTEEQAHWLRLQVYKEMFGSGLSGHADGIIRGFIEKLSASLPHAQTKEQRNEFRARHPRARRGVQPLPPLRRYP